MPLRRLLFAATCLFALFSAQAQDAAERPANTGWSLGALALVRDSAYIGAANRTLVVPAVGYESRRVFFRGLQLGWHAWRHEGLQLDVVAQARLEGFDARDIPIAGLQNRRKSMDLDAVLTLASAAGKLEFTGLTDAMGRSGGQELAVNYGYSITAGRVRITPKIGVRWWSSSLADYYYGIRPREVAHGAPTIYRVSSALIPEVGVNLIAPLSQR